MKTDKATSWISRQLRGENQPTTDTASQRPDKMMASAISDKLQAGPQAPSDTLTPGDAVDQPTNDAASIEAEARDKLDQLDPEIGVAIDDDADPLHAVAVRLLAAYVALEKIKAAAA
jgi:hypothetical protein